MQGSSSRAYRAVFLEGRALRDCAGAAWQCPLHSGGPCEGSLGELWNGESPPGRPLIWHPCTSPGTSAWLLNSIKVYSIACCSDCVRLPVQRLALTYAQHPCWPRVVTTWTLQAGLHHPLGHAAITYAVYSYGKASAKSQMEPPCKASPAECTVYIQYVAVFLSSTDFSSDVMTCLALCEAL